MIVSCRCCGNNADANVVNELEETTSSSSHPSFVVYMSLPLPSTAAADVVARSFSLSKFTFSPEPFNDIEERIISAMVGFPEL